MSKETESVEEEIREQQEKLKDMTLKGKLDYLLYYYKWHFLIGLVVTIAAVSTISGIITRPSEAFYTCLLDIDHPMTDADLLTADFGSYASLGKRETAVFDTTITLQSSSTLFASDAYDSADRLNAMFIVGRVDVVCSDAAFLDDYTRQDALTDVSTLLDPDTYSTLKDKGLIYTASMDDGSTYPVGVLISGSQVLGMYGFYEPEREVYACVVANAPHKPLFETFIKFLDLT